MTYQFKCDYELLTEADSGPRDPGACLWGIFHTTEDPENKDPRATARWQQDTSNNSSYNVLFGSDGSTVRSNDDDYCPWSVGMPGNRLGLHGSAIGKASKTRQQWLQYPAQLESMARWAADLSARYGIPLVWLSVDQVAGQKARGFCSHGTYYQAIAKAQGMDFRSDPGPGFPHDLVLQRAEEIKSGGNVSRETPSKQEAPRMDKTQAIFEQLAGPGNDYAGWKQLGNRTVVDVLGAIGEKMGIPGCYDIKGGGKNGS